MQEPNVINCRREPVFGCADAGAGSARGACTHVQKSLGNSAVYSSCGARACACACACACVCAWLGTSVGVCCQPLQLRIKRHLMLQTVPQRSTAAPPPACTGIFQRLLRPHVELWAECARAQVAAAARRLRAHGIVVDGRRDKGSSPRRDAGGGAKYGAGRVWLKTIEMCTSVS